VTDARVASAEELKKFPGEEKKGSVVVKFSPEGKVLMTLGKPGVKGNPPDALTDPNDVVTDPANGDVYVAESHTNVEDPNLVGRISVFDRTGKFLRTIGKAGQGPGEFRTPHALEFDSQGRLIWCADNDRAVMRLEKDGTTRTVLSSGSNDGKRFSGPNDIVVAKDDAVYLTDNDFGLRDGGQNPDKQLPNGIWRIKDGKSTMVLDAMVLGGIPNGIVLSPDEKYLYANAGQRMMRYEMKADGSLGPGSPFTQGPGIGDGMKVDTLGNVYSTSGAGPGIVRITSPTGTLLGYLNLPIVGGEPKRQICATNVAFGDLDAKSLYVTACDHVYRIRMKVAGVMPGPRVR